jgi:hypothetical protein
MASLKDNCKYKILIDGSDIFPITEISPGNKVLPGDGYEKRGIEAIKYQKTNSFLKFK